MATTLMHEWAAQSQIISSADSWITMAGTTAVISSDVDLETGGYLGCVVTPEVDFDSTPTDYVDIKAYFSLDGTNYSDSPDLQFRIDKATDPHQRSLIVRDVPHFIITATQSGSTDSHNVRAYQQCWRGTTS